MGSGKFVPYGWVMHLAWRSSTIIRRYEYEKDAPRTSRRINEIVHGKRRITADTELHLAHYFKISPQFWLSLQMDYGLDVAEDRLADRLSAEVKTYKAT